MRSILFLVPLVAMAQISRIETTATQAVITYTTPTIDPCTITSTPAIFDIDQTKFSSANVDMFRSSSVFHSTTARTVVLGSPTIELGTDGKRYSRALAADTVYVVTVTCGGSAWTSNVITRSPVVGDVAPSASPGAMTIDPADQSKEYVDPNTGVKFKILGRTGDHGGRSPSVVSFGEAVASAGTWSNIGNLKSGGASFAATTDGGAAVLYLDPQSGNNMLDRGWGANFFFSLDDLQLSVTANGDNATTANRQYAVCFTADHGATCRGTEITQTANLTTNTTITMPSSFPSAPFSGWGTVIGREDLPAFGSINCTAGSCTLVFPNNESRIGHMVLTKVRIAGTAPTCPGNICDVVARTGSTGLTLAQSVTVSSASFYTLPLGIRIRKLTTTGTLSISAGYRVAGGLTQGLRAESPKFSPLKFDGASGKMRLVIVPLQVAGQWSMYAVGDDGTSNYLGLAPSTDPAPDKPSGAVGSSITGRIAGFSTSDPRKFYAFLPGNDGNMRLFEGTYSGDGSRRDLNYTGGVGGDLPALPSDQVTWTSKLNFTAAVASATHYNTATYGQATDFQVTEGQGISGDYLIAYRNYGGIQDGSPAWIAVIRLSTGQLVRLFHTLDGNDGTGTPMEFTRWCGIHSIAALDYPEGSYILSCAHLKTSMASRNSGPFTLALTGVKRGGTFSADTSLNWTVSGPDSSYDNACPSDLAQRWKDLGAVGNQCVTVRTTGIAYTGAGASDTTTYIEGDLLYNSIKTGVSFVSDSEHFRVVKAPVSLGGGQFEVVLQRDAIKEYCGFNSPEVNQNPVFLQHQNGWVPIFASAREETCSGANFLVSASASTATEMTRELSVSHYDVGPSLIGSEMLFTSSAGTFDGQVSKLSIYPGVFNRWRLSGFAGVSPSNVPVQGYPKHTQRGSNLQPWLVDTGAYNGGAGFGWEEAGFLGANTITLVAPSIYKISINGSGSYKSGKLFGWAGRQVLGEKSSAVLGDTLTAADPWKFCYAYRAGECRTGSAAGEVFAVLPLIDLGSNCVAGRSSSFDPCIMWAHNYGGHAFRRGVRDEVNGETVQKLTTMLGPWHGSYSKLLPLPDGLWALGHMGRWVDSWTGGLLVKLPTYRPDSRSTSRSTFTARTIAGLPTGITIWFGRNPQFHCIVGRAEPCKVSAATINQADPFKFAHEALAASSAASIDLPLSPGVWYWGYSQAGTPAGVVVVP